MGHGNFVLTVYLGTELDVIRSTRLNHQTEKSRDFTGIVSHMSRDRRIST